MRKVLGHTFFADVLLLAGGRSEDDFATALETPVFVGTSLLKARVRPGGSPGSTVQVVESSDGEDATLGGKVIRVRKRLDDEAGRYSVGRKGDNDVVVDNHSVSKTHAFLEWRGDDLYVIDSGSLNGTFVNDRRLAEGESRIVRDGDVVTFGLVKLQYFTPRALYHALCESIEDE